MLIGRPHWPVGVSACGQPIRLAVSVTERWLSIGPWQYYFPSGRPQVSHDGEMQVAQRLRQRSHGLVTDAHKRKQDERQLLSVPRPLSGSGAGVVWELRRAWHAHRYTVRHQYRLQMLKMAQVPTLAA